MFGVWGSRCFRTALAALSISAKTTGCHPSMAHAIDADSTPLQKLAYFMFSTLPQADAIAVTLFLIRWYAGRTKGVTMPKSLREMSLAELRTARKGWEGRTDHGSKLMLQRFDQEIAHVEKHGREFAEPAKGKKWGRPFGGDAVALLDPVVSVPLVGMPLTSTDDQEAHNLRRDIAYREMLQPGMVPLVGGLSLDAAPLECDKCGKKFDGAHAGVACPKCGSDDTMLRTSY